MTTKIPYGFTLAMMLTLSAAAQPPKPRTATKPVEPVTATTAPTVPTVDPTPAPSPDGELNGDIFIVTRGGQNFKLGLISVSAIPESVFQPFIDDKKANGAAILAAIGPELAIAEETALKAEAEHKRLGDIYNASDPFGFGYGNTDTKNKKKLAASQAAVKENRDAWQAADEVRKQASSARYALKDKQQFYTSAAYYSTGIPAGVATDKTDADGKFALIVPRTGKFVVVANAKRTVGAKTEEYHWMVWTSLDGQASKRVMLSNDNMIGEKSPESAVQ